MVGGFRLGHPDWRSVVAQAVLLWPDSGMRGATLIYLDPARPSKYHQKWSSFKKKMGRSTIFTGTMVWVYLYYIIHIILYMIYTYYIYIYYVYIYYVYIYISISCINPAGHSTRGFCLGHPAGSRSLAVSKIPLGGWLVIGFGPENVGYIPNEIDIYPLVN